MKLRNQLLKYNLQYFADNNGNAGLDETENSGVDGDDNQDDDEHDESQDDGQQKSKKLGKKYLTQEDVDRIVEERLKRERKKLQKQQQSKDDKQSDKDSDDNSKDDANAKKLSDLEMKVLCYDHDIAKEYVREAIAIAKAYVDEDTNMDEALEMVTKKFPQFVKGYKADKNQEDSDEDEDDAYNRKAWGQRQKKEANKPKTLEDEIKDKLFGKG